MKKRRRQKVKQKNQTKMDLNLENHAVSCRFCINHFEIEDVEIKITKKVQEMYLCLTGIDVSS